MGCGCHIFRSSREAALGVNTTTKFTTDLDSNTDLDVIIESIIGGTALQNTHPEIIMYLLN